MAIKETHGVSKGARLFFSGTFISRISGLGRDVSMAFCFGAHPALAAFMVAFRFANLFRRIVGESTVSAGFVPYFESLRYEDPAKAATFFRDTFFSLLCLVGGLVVVSGLILGGLLPLNIFSVSYQQVAFLTCLMLPGLIFICLYALSSALLQCQKRFFLTAVSPALFNVVWILGAFVFRRMLPEKAVMALSFAVVVGFFMQWALLIGPIQAYLRSFLSWKQVFSFRFLSPEVKKLLAPMGFGLVGVSATQVNSLMDAIFARLSSLEGPAYLWYAIRIQQLPMALFGLSLASALLPALSRAFSRGSEEEYSRVLHFSLDKALCFLLPCSFALFALAPTGVNLLFGRGNFSLEDTRQTIFCLWGYGLGLIPYVLVLLLVSAFHARKNFSLPMKIAVLSMLFNVGLNAIFVMGLGLGAVSVALSTSVSAWFNCIFLYSPLKKFTLFSYETFKTLMCCVGAGSLCVWLGRYFDMASIVSLFSVEFHVPREFLLQAAQFLFQTSVFLLSLLALAMCLKAKDLLSIVGLNKEKEVVRR